MASASNPSTRSLGRLSSLKAGCLGSNVGTGSVGSGCIIRRGSQRPAARAEAAAACEGGAANSGSGFAAVVEPLSLQVAAGSVAPYALPEELLRFQPPAEAVLARFKNGETERTVHSHVELTDCERRKLAALQELAKEQGCSFMPSVAASATRYLGRARGDVRRALRDMAATQEWRAAYFRDAPLSDGDAELAEDLSLGIAYFSGRDRWMRPVLTLRLARIPEAWHRNRRAGGDRLVRLLVFCLEYMARYLLLPGRVEGGVALLDMSGLSASQVPFGMLKSIGSIMANHYANRIFRFYMVHLPTALGMTAQMGLRLLTERQRQKLQIVRNLAELQQEFALHQLEQDFGGLRPAVETFYPFPLQAGPFEAGSTQPPSLGALKGLRGEFAEDLLAMSATDIERCCASALSMQLTTTKEEADWQSESAEQDAGVSTGTSSSSRSISPPLPASAASDDSDALDNSDGGLARSSSKQDPEPEPLADEGAVPPQNEDDCGKMEETISTDAGSSAEGVDTQSSPSSRGNTDPAPFLVEDTQIQPQPSACWWPFRCAAAPSTTTAMQAPAVM